MTDTNKVFTLTILYLLHNDLMKFVSNMWQVGCFLWKVIPTKGIKYQSLISIYLIKLLYAIFIFKFFSAHDDFRWLSVSLSLQCEETDVMLW
jgi:hypothetical protein